MKALSHLDEDEPGRPRGDSLPFQSRAMRGGIWKTPTRVSFSPHGSLLRLSPALSDTLQNSHLPEPGVGAGSPPPRGKAPVTREG